MATTISDLRARAKTPEAKKAIRYALVSVISSLISLVAFVILKGFAHVDAVPANIAAVIIGGVPSYYLNRLWAWGKSGKSHMWKEVVPFWVLAFLGLAVSTGAVAFADHFATSHDYSHLVTTLGDTFANAFAFGVLWIGKFFIFNKLMFVDRHAPQP